MKQLFIDSSTNVLFVAIGKDGRLIEKSVRIGRQDHAKYIIDIIDLLLKRKDVKIDDINKIYVGYGPGSYTGLRVSVMVAKMLAYTKGIKLFAVSSLYFLSSGYNFIKAPMIDARNGNVFCGIYDDTLTLLEEGLRKTEDLQKLAIKTLAKPVMIDDFHYEVNLKKIMEKAKEIKDIHLFEPKYLKRPQAEINHD